ncbi:TetR/AcrR family transcriptional regulator [Niallia sp. Krafla_26]|uniref:TetR/AcrR family transcriptional regulator n=1 Tax=Niallia sp. Krafla_26 TaxID=3064703 RepID=UPI003D17901D
MTTSDKILKVAIELMASKGYKGATTKLIAEKANVSEMTVFRQFKTKRKILEEAIDRYYYTIQFKELFKERIVYDLEKDLMMVAKLYHKLMKNNKNVIKIAIQEGNNVKGLLDQVNKHPRQLKELLVQYFNEMRDKNLIIEDDYEAKAMNFLYLHYGIFISRSFVAGEEVTAETITSLPEEALIKDSVQVLVNQLSPTYSKQLN